MKKAADYVKKSQSKVDRITVSLPKGTADLIRSKGIPISEYVRNLCLYDLKNTTGIPP